MSKRYRGGKAEEVCDTTAEEKLEVGEEVGKKSDFIQEPRRMISSSKSFHCGGVVSPTTNLPTPSLSWPQSFEPLDRFPFHRKVVFAVPVSQFGLAHYYANELSKCEERTSDLHLVAVVSANTPLVPRHPSIGSVPVSRALYFEGDTALATAARGD